MANRAKHLNPNPRRHLLQTIQPILFSNLRIMGFQKHHSLTANVGRFGTSRALPQVGEPHFCALKRRKAKNVRHPIAVSYTVDERFETFDASQNTIIWKTKFPSLLQIPACNWCQLWWLLILVCEPWLSTWQLYSEIGCFRMFHVFKKLKHPTFGVCERCTYKSHASA